MKENAAVVAAAVAAEAVRKAAGDTRPPLTVYTMEQYTRQEVYDFIVTRVIQQGRPALDKTGHCVLLDHAGNRCAVGMLVPGREGYLKGQLNAGDASCSAHWSLLVSLQRAHDAAAMSRSRTDAHTFVRRFREEARDTARGLCLDPAAACR